MQLEEVKIYWGNGKLRYHCFCNEQRKKHGRFISYFRDGSIAYEINYRDGLYHGKYIDYRKDGTIYQILYHWHDKEVTKAEFLKLKYNEVMK